MIVLFATLIALAISAVLYRCGGMSKDATAKPTWIPVWARERLVRRWGCPLLSILYLILFGLSCAWWVHAIVFVCAWLAITTYWDDVFGEDNFYMHGLVLGLAYLPYFMVIPWYAILTRAVIMSIFMGLWCKFWINDVAEEFGRGGIISATLPIMLI